MKIGGYNKVIYENRWSKWRKKLKVDKTKKFMNGGEEKRTGLDVLGTIAQQYVSLHI